VESAAAQRAAAQANQTALEQKVAGVCAPLLNPLSGQSYAPTNSTACGQAKAAADAAVQAGNAAVDAAQGQLDLLRRGGTPATQASLQAQVTSAQALVAATRARLEALRTTGVDAQRAQIQSQKDQALSQLTTAQESSRTAEARLRAARDGTLDAQRKAIQSQTEAARARLTADQAHLEQLVAGPQDEEVQAAQDAVDQAAQQLALVSQPVTQPEIAAQQALVEQAHQQLLKAQRPYTDSDIAQQQHVVAQAEAALRARANPYTDQDLAAARAQLDQAQVGLQQAQLALDQTEVRAPVDGGVSDRQINPGALVVPQTTILTLMPPALEVEVHVDEARLGDIKPGQTAQLHLTAYPEQVFTGSVRAVAPALDSRTRTASVQIEPLDPTHQLKPGMQAMVTVVCVKSDALVVPREAVLGSLLAGAKATVVTIENNHAERRPVRIGVVDDRVAEITSGLQEGDVVATTNAGGINNGDAVSPRLLAAREPSGASGQ
ncbi:MAG TPA: efflux RND transporter periplasmic adaptor subunit, partial [Chloroflexota bacterium]